MSGPDRRSLACNGRVAAAELEGIVEADRFVSGTWQSVVQPVADMWAAPGMGRDCQILYGQQVRVLEDREGWAFVQVARDGYVGYVQSGALAARPTSTHRVAVPASHLYPEPDIKVPETSWLSFGSELRVVSASGAFFETAEGQFVPKPHLRPLNTAFADPVTVAQMLFGVPYLWAGNSAAGIDCSGLVQAAWLAAGRPCPRDSDQQQVALGTDLAEDDPTQRGDLFFWKGHVALAVDGETLIHANAHAMAVAYEPIEAALNRIALHEFGELVTRKRG